MVATGIDPAPVRVLRQYIWRESGTAAPPSSAVSRVRRGQVQVALVGVALWLGGLIPGILPWPGVVYACLGVVAIVWLLTLVLRPAESTLLALTLMVTAVVILFTTRAQEVGSPLAAAWFDAAAVSMIGMATLRRALVWLAVIAVVSLSSWSVLAATTGIAGGWRSAVAWPVAAVSLGLASAGMAAIVRAGGRRLDDTVSSAQQVITDEEVLEAEGAEHSATTRLLHDTVINTLTAIGRGVPVDDLPALQKRCRQDLDLIDRTLPREHYDATLAAAGARAAALGLDLQLVGTVATSSDALRTVHADVQTAVGGAINEALLNVAKHAQASSVVIRLVDTEDHVRIEITDDGRGWSGQPVAGGGIERSILARCTEVGVSAEVRSLPTGGAMVALVVPLGTADDGEDVFVDESRIMTATVCGVLLVDMGIRTILTVGLEPAWGAAVAYALLVIVMVWPWLRRSTWLAPGPLGPLGLALVGVPIVLLLPEQQGAISWVWWGSLAAIAIFLALVSMNASAWWIALGYGLQMAGRYVAGGFSLDLVVPDAFAVGLGAVAALWIRARVLDLMAETAAVARERDESRAQLLRDTASRRESVARLRQATDFGRGPLESIAAGRRTGAESDVREEAARLAPYLRNVSRVGPELGGLGFSLVGLLDAGLAARAQVAMNIDPGARPPAPAGEAALARLVAGVGPALRPGAECSITLLRGPTGTLFTVLGPAGCLGARQLEEVRSAGLTVSDAPADDIDWAEIAWSAHVPELSPDDDGGDSGGSVDEVPGEGTANVVR